MSRQIHILFLCVANSARSQIAEGLAKKIFGDTANIASAGSVPSGKVQPLAVEVLKEEQIDISENWSKSIEQLPHNFLNRLEYVITLCGEEVCPVLPSAAKRIHWPMPDPVSVDETQKLDAFRQVRNHIRENLLAFQNEIIIPSDN